MRIKCPRCRQANLFTEIHTFKYGGVYPCLIEAQSRCVAPACDFEFRYIRNSLLSGREYVRPMLPVNYHLSDIQKLFEYNHIGPHIIYVWDGLCTLRFSLWLWDRISFWFKFMLYNHRIKWHKIIKKVLDPDLIHPDLIRAFIVPMLGFDLQGLYYRLVCKCADWEGTAYSGARFLFDE